MEYRIFGPPGIGKTTTLSQKIKEACQRYGSDHVIVASFTKVAAEQLIKNNPPINKERVGTLHALCHRLLDKPPLAVDMDILHEWNTDHPEFAVSEGSKASLDDPFWEPNRNDTKRGDELSQRYHARRITKAGQ